MILRDINQRTPRIDNIIINLDYGKESKCSICCVANTINFSIQLSDKTEEVKKKKRWIGCRCSNETLDIIFRVSNDCNLEYKILNIDNQWSVIAQVMKNA